MQPIIVVDGVEVDMAALHSRTGTGEDRVSIHEQILPGDEV
jgi:hypothetical protein